MASFFWEGVFTKEGSVVIFVKKKSKESLPAPSKGANETLRDGELTPFRNHLAPFGRSR